MAAFKNKFPVRHSVVHVVAVGSEVVVGLFTVVMGANESEGTLFVVNSAADGPGDRGLISPTSAEAKDDVVATKSCLDVMGDDCEDCLLKNRSRVVSLFLRLDVGVRGWCGEDGDIWLCDSRRLGVDDFGLLSDCLKLCSRGEATAVTGPPPPSPELLS